MGSRARRSRSSPDTNSRFTSKPDDEEKDHHQAIVDPVIERVRASRTHRGNTHRCLPEGQIRLGRRRVGQHSATTVTTSSTTPLADSTCRNRASGAVMRSIAAGGSETSYGWLCAIKFLTSSEAGVE